MTKEQIKHVKELKRKLKKKSITLVSIAREYGCSYQHLFRVLNGECSSKPLLDFMQSKLQKA